MRMPTAGENMTVFLLFFGIATLDAFASRSWLSAAFWLGIGLVFLGASIFGRRRSRSAGAAPGEPAR